MVLSQKGTLNENFIDQTLSENDGIEISANHQAKISKILGATNIDDRTKFLLLAAL